MRNKAALCLAAITLAAFTSCADPMRGELDLYCPEDHFLFRIIDNDTAVEITGYVGGRIDVRIPPFIGGLPVTVIGERAFVGGEWIPDENWEFVFVAGHQLVRVAIPDSVTYIGSEAFAGNWFTSVTIPDSLVYIGWNAFYRNQLTSVMIPNSVTSIGPGAFADNQLAYVTIPISVSFIGRIAFWNNRLTYVIIPNSEAVVWYSAFDDEVTVRMGEN